MNIVITGASKGIGFAIANKFASTANVTKLNNQFKCDICNFITNTVKSLSAHKRVHKTNKT